MTSWGSAFVRQQQPVVSPLFRLLLRSTSSTSSRAAPIPISIPDPMREDDGLWYQCRSGGVGNLDDATHGFDAMITPWPLPSTAAGFFPLLGPVVRKYPYAREVDRPGDGTDFHRQIKSLCRWENVNLAFAVMGRMVRLGFELNRVTLTTLVDGLCIQGKISQAVKLVDKMVEVEFDAGSVIIDLAKTDTPLKLDWAGLLKRYEVKIDAATYSAVVEGLVEKKGNLFDAFHLVNRMVDDRGALPDLLTYNSLIHAMAYAGCYEHVKVLLSRMTEKNHTTFHIILDALCRLGSLSEADATLGAMIQRGLLPTLGTYQLLISGYCLHGPLAKSVDLYLEMLEQGLHPNIVTWNTLLAGFCRIGPMQPIEEVFMKKMQDAGHTPDLHTYYILMDGYCRHGNLDRATALFRRLDAEYSTDRVLLNILLKGMCRAGKPEDAKSMFRSFFKNRVTPPPETLTALIDGLCEEGRYTDALDFLREMECRQDPVTYKSLVEYVTSVASTYNSSSAEVRC